MAAATPTQRARIRTLVTLFFVVLSINGITWALASTPAKVVVLPFHVAPGEEQKELKEFGDHAYQRIRAALELLAGAVTLQSEEATRKLLENRTVPGTESEATQLASESGSDLAVFGYLSTEDSQYRMRGLMWDLRKGRVSVSTDLKVANIHGLAGILEIFIGQIGRRLHSSPSLPFYKPEPSAATGGLPGGRIHTRVSLPRDEGPWRSPEIQTSLRALDIGDIDGDGKNETVFLDDAAMTISRFEDGSLRALAQLSQPPAGYISVEVEDLDGDGISEILLRYRTPKGIESAIVRYLNRNLEVADKFPNMVLATIPDPRDEKKRVLVGQPTDRRDMFNGEMVLFNVDGTQVRPEGKVMLPPGTFLLSYASGRLGKDSSLLRVILNQDQRLMVFDGENRLLQNLTDRIYGINRSVRVPWKGRSRDVTIPGRLLITDTDGDGENELLVTRESREGSFVEALAWDGKQLNMKWRTVASPGIISDFRIRDFKNAGGLSLVLVLVHPNPLSALLGGGRSILFAYDLLP